MAIIDITWKPTRTQLRLFALLQIVFFGLIALTVYRHTESVRAAWIIVGCSAAIGAIGVAFPPFMRVIYVVWMGALLPVGFVVSHVLMLAMFYLVFLPIGLIMRLVGHDPMQRRLDRDADSYWVSRKQNDDKQRYFKQF